MNVRTALLALVSIAGTAPAATITWNINGPDSLWTNPANWIGGRVPGVNDYVEIPAGGTPLVTGYVGIRDLLVRDGGGLVILGQFYVYGSASIHFWGTMSIAGSGAEFVHQDDVHNNGTITMWSGAGIGRLWNGSGSFIVDPSGSIVIPAYDSGGVTLGTYLQLNGYLQHDSNQPLWVGRRSANWGDATYIAIQDHALMEFSASCVVDSTNYAGQTAPYIVNDGSISVIGLTSDVVTFSAGLPLLNDKYVVVDKPDLHILNSWDVSPDGTLVRGRWDCRHFGRIFLDNTTMNAVGSGATIAMSDPGSMFVPLQQARQNDGLIVLSGTSAFINPASHAFSNHGDLIIDSNATVGINGQFDNAPGGSLTCNIAGSTPGSYGTIVAESATLAGTVNARFVDGYRPSRGDSQTVVAASQWLSGQFDAIDVYFTSVPIEASYDPTTATLVAGCIADFDGDGTADFFDYDAFVTCFEGGFCVGRSGGDIDADGVVDFFDYDAFVREFEAGC
ncbi:MAG: hypothetical protein AABZ53_07585 [Planctomycetota bacterium]